MKVCRNHGHNVFQKNLKKPSNFHDPAFLQGFLIKLMYKNTKEKPSLWLIFASIQTSKYYVIFVCHNTNLYRFLCTDMAKKRTFWIWLFFNISRAIDNYYTWGSRLMGISLLQISLLWFFKKFHKFAVWEFWAILFPYCNFRAKIAKEIALMK